jgi:hypothetical protein
MAMAADPLMFDRTIFFDSVRGSLFGGALSQQQVDGMNAVLGQWEAQQTGVAMTDTRWLAYMLATTFHETAKTMWPIEEYGKGSGRPYGKKDPETGQTYYGRGFVQLTWRDNYAKATKKLGLTGDRDIEWHADQALDLVIASRIMFQGMTEGWFRQKDGKPETLGRYFNDTVDDPVNARGIINGDVSKMGKQVASYYDKFRAALKAAKIPEPAPAPTPPPEQTPILVAITIPPGSTPVAVTVNGEIMVASS